MAKKPKPPRLPVPLSDLEEHLRDQLGFLSKSAAAFDGGDMAEFRRMAATTRLLLHDTPISHSLAGQLNLKTSLFVDGGHPYSPHNLMSELCLVGMRMDQSGASYIPNFQMQGLPMRLVPFDNWWTRIVLRDQHGTTMSRGDFVTVIANQAGGAHVDPEIDERYHRLSKEYSAGWMFATSQPGVGTPSEQGTPLDHIEKMYIRQIAAEVLQTLEPAWQAIIGNRGCDCGSGRKARYCCLK